MTRVAVVGAGIMGSAAAYALARDGHDVSLYEQFVALLRARGVHTETGEFGAMMQVDLVNDGPVTLWLER